jgi:hypothetical protein
MCVPWTTLAIPGIRVLFESKVVLGSDAAAEQLGHHLKRSSSNSNSNSNSSNNNSNSNNRSNNNNNNSNSNNSNNHDHDHDHDQQQSLAATRGSGSGSSGPSSTDEAGTTASTNGSGGGSSKAQPDPFLYFCNKSSLQFCGAPVPHTEASVVVQFAGSVEIYYCITS